MLFVLASYCKNDMLRFLLQFVLLMITLLGYMHKQRLRLYHRKWKQSFYLQASSENVKSSMGFLKSWLRKKSPALMQHFAASIIFTVKIVVMFQYLPNQTNDSWL